MADTTISFDFSLVPPTAEQFHESLRTGGPGRLHVAESLLALGADINGLYEDISGFGRIKSGGPVGARTQATHLYNAAQREDFEGVQFLLDKGADIRKQNISAVTIRSAPFPGYRAADTLTALDGMRTSQDMRIVELAEHLYGLETEEKVARRKTAFEGVPGWPPWRKMPPLTEEQGIAQYGKDKWARMRREREKNRKREEALKKGLDEKRSRQKEELERLRRVRKAKTAEAEGRKVYDLRVRK